MKKQILILLAIIIVQLSCKGQEHKNKFESKIGYGYYQGFNIGLNYFYTGKLKAGIGAGSHLNIPPLENNNHINIYIENTLYFGNLNRQNVGGWYFNQQLMYWKQGPDNNRWEIVSLGLNIGKTIPITKRIGLDMEIGPALNLVADINRDPLVESCGWMWPVLYNGRVQLTYKF
ncbi:MAG: hypothetical protein JXB00_04710 [Bacteroidales bacterium]|nr:hypothetical protein [Bacteroidales bacterium]